MSFDTIWNSENPSFEKTKNLLDIDVSWIEQDYVKVHDIQNMELVDSEDNKVTIPSDLQDFFSDEFNINEKNIEWKVTYVKNEFYDSLWIDKNIDNIKDNKVKLFKWLVDWWTLTLEEIESLYDNWIGDIVENIKKLDTPEKIWDFTVSLWEDVVESLKWIWEPYQTWMIIWWLWTWPFKFSKFFTKLDKIDWKDNDKQETNEITNEVENLYEDPKYSYLEKHKDILWENITTSDIVWEWTQAIIMKNPINDSLVVKIAKEWQVDDILEEFNNHKLFLDTWKSWIKNWDLDLKVRIPQVFKWKDDWHFYIEKIDWQSLYSKTLIERFDKKLDLEDKKILSNLSDKQVREYLKNKFWEKDSYLDMLIEDYSVEHLAEQLWTSYLYRKKHWKIWDTPLSNTLDYLKKKWISHNDLHPWNVMLDKKWNVYIIDFWRIKLIDNK